MQSTKYQNPSSQPDQRANKPLAKSVFDGENRLRELEHLAETARKVRDQAAADLTRNGSAHHIARDRLASAERMLQKTRQEMAELRRQLGLQAAPAKAATKQSNKAQDFELAMLLGHSKARFSLDDVGPDSFQIEPENGAQAQPSSKTRPTARQTAQARSVTRRRRANPSALRLLGVGLFALIGTGLGAVGTYLFVSSDSVPDAAHNVTEGAQQMATRLKALLPKPDSNTDSKPVASLSTQTQPVAPPHDQQPAAVPARSAAAASQTSSARARPAAPEPLNQHALQGQLEAQLKQVRQAAAQRHAAALAARVTAPQSTSSANMATASTTTTHSAAPTDQAYQATALAAEAVTAHPVMPTHPALAADTAVPGDPAAAQPAAPGEAPLH